MIRELRQAVVAGLVLGSVVAVVRLWLRLVDAIAAAVVGRFIR